MAKSKILSIEIIFSYFRYNGLCSIIVFFISIMQLFSIFSIRNVLTTMASNAFEAVVVGKVQNKACILIFKCFPQQYDSYIEVFTSLI